MNEADFRQALKEQGYGEATPVELEPDFSNDMHTHDFSAFLLVQSGEFTLVTEEGSVTHGPGETCQLAAGRHHCERTGAQGVRFLLGRKQP